MKQLLTNKIHSNSSYWYLENRIPTLGEVRNKIILATRLESEEGLYFNWEEQGDRTILKVPVTKSRFRQLYNATMSANL